MHIWDWDLRALRTYFIVHERALLIQRKKRHINIVVTLPALYYRKASLVDPLTISEASPDSLRSPTFAESDQQLKSYFTDYRLAIVKKSEA